ncbi:MAG: hypothetical protein GY782_11765 [Gammaproteobacteria bacterium]|nr:hypothetical protein [Gammaproteobacteria bacterium]
MQSQQAPQFNNKQLLTLVSLARKALLASIVKLEVRQPLLIYFQLNS